MAEEEKQHEIQQAEEKATPAGHAGTRQEHAKVLHDVLVRVREDQKLLDHELMVEGNSMIGVTDQSDTAKIQHVPEILRQSANFDKYFKPRAMTIGPIHAANSELISNKLKVKFVAKFIKDNDQRAETLLKVVEEKIQTLRNCFDQQVTAEYDDNSLAWLLFFDGCAVLQFLHNNFSITGLNELKISNGEAALIQQDLFSLENQVPYQLLKLLLGLLDSKKQDDYLLAISIAVLKNNIMAPIDIWEEEFFVPAGKLAGHLKHSMQPEMQPVHLLDLLKLILLGDNFSFNKNNEKKYDFISKYVGYYDNPTFIEDIRRMMENMQLDNKRSFRNIRELKSAGIELHSSESRNILSVSFSSSRYFNITGHLKIPPITVDNSTARKLLNLVAFEMCLNDIEQRPLQYLVTSYVNLLDLLIDNEEDVRELRKANILRHRLSSDNEVADLFNSFGSYCLLLPIQDVFVEVTRKIDKQCKNKLAIWTAQFCNDHCSSPWTVVAFVLALIAAFLTLNQFLSAVIPKGVMLNHSIDDFYKSA